MQNNFFAFEQWFGHKRKRSHTSTVQEIALLLCRSIHNYANGRVNMYKQYIAQHAIPING